MPTITITLTLKEAETLCIAMRRVDPFGVFGGDIIKRIDAAAREILQEPKNASPSQK